MKYYFDTTCQKAGVTLHRETSGKATKLAYRMMMIT